MDKTELAPDGRLVARFYGPVQWLYSHSTIYAGYIASVNRILGLSE